MSYHLFIRIDDENVRTFYEHAIDKFNNNINKTHRDSGFDLFISQPFQCENKPKKPISIDHNVTCAVYRKNYSDTSCDLVPSGYYMYPRSSISKTAFRLANSVGIIDAGYRGHLIAKVDCIYHTTGHDLEHGFGIGDRLFQICAPDLSPFQSVQIVESFDNTERGEGGFGSTG
jgi:dUTP pyrophosphatase